MKQRLFDLMKRDQLILHKIGLIVGAVLGFVGGLIISERANGQQVTEATENDGPE
jgi:hypothetical protein